MPVWLDPICLRPAGQAPIVMFPLHKPIYLFSFKPFLGQGYLGFFLQELLSGLVFCFLYWDKFSYGVTFYSFWMGLASCVRSAVWCIKMSCRGNEKGNIAFNVMEGLDMKPKWWNKSVEALLTCQC